MKVTSSLYKINKQLRKTWMHEMELVFDDVPKMTVNEIQTEIRLLILDAIEDALSQGYRYGYGSSNTQTMEAPSGDAS